MLKLVVHRVFPGTELSAEWPLAIATGGASGARPIQIGAGSSDQDIAMPTGVRVLGEISLLVMNGVI